MKCLNNAIATANNLEMAINIINSVIDTQKSAYSVNDVSAARSYLNQIKAKEEKIYSNIVNNVIPGTRAIIKELDYKIKDAVMQEKMDS